MRNFFSWIWDELFSSSTNYLTLSLVAFAGVTLFSSIYLYQALQTATLEKEQALAQIATLEKTLAILQIAKEADNTAAHIIIHQNDVWNDLNTKVALEIAEIPKIEWTSSPQKTLDTESNSAKEKANIYTNEEKNLRARTSSTRNDVPSIQNNNHTATQTRNKIKNIDNTKERTPSTQRLRSYAHKQKENDVYNNTSKYPDQQTSAAHNDTNQHNALSKVTSLHSRNNTLGKQEEKSFYAPKDNRISNHFVEQKRQYNETIVCNIDTPLPRLSAPLIMLYNEISRSHTATASFMAHGDKTSTRSASQGDERPSVGAVGTRASYHLR